METGLNLQDNHNYELINIWPTHICIIHLLSFQKLVKLCELLSYFSIIL